MDHGCSITSPRGSSSVSRPRGALHVVSTARVRSARNRSASLPGCRRRRSPRRLQHRGHHQHRHRHGHDRDHRRAPGPGPAAPGLPAGARHRHRLRPPEPLRTEHGQRLRLGRQIPRPLARVPHRLGHPGRLGHLLRLHQRDHGLRRPDPRQQGRAAQRRRHRPRPDVHRRHHRRRPGDPRRPHRPRRHRYPGRHPLPVRPPGLRVRGPAGFLRLGPDHRRPRLLAVLVQPLRDLQRQDLRPGHGPRGVLLLGLGRRLQRQRGDEEPGRGGPRRPHRPVRDARPVPLRLGRLPARDEPRRTRQERPPGAPVPRRETRRRTLGHPPRGRADVLRRRLRAGHPDPHRARTVRHEPRPHHGPAVDPHPPALRHPRHAAPPS